MRHIKRRSKKRQNVFIFLFIAVLIILILGILILLLVLNNKNEDSFVYNENYYDIRDRSDKIKENKKTDASDYNTIGWVQVQGTNIDMPVLRAVGEGFTNPVEKEGYGWVESDDSNYHNVINVLGHNIFNLSSKPKLSSDTFKRFEELMGFVYYDFAKDNEYIQLTMDGKEYVYKIFATSFVNASEAVVFPNGEYTKEEKKKYLKMMKENSIYDYDVDVSEEDDFASVSTCTRMLGTDVYVNFFVVGRLMRKDEKYDNYIVKKNDNYKKIDKILKGDDDNEESDSV